MVEYGSTEYETSMIGQGAFPGFHLVEGGLPFYLFLITRITFGEARLRDSPLDRANLGR